MQAAVQYIAAKADVDDLCLLSPACASFDSYSGFAARGEDFVQHVQALEGAA